LLDWSLSPYIAAYFSTNHKDFDGEIWSFEYEKYLEEASKQWTETNKSENRYTVAFDARLCFF
ncbi:MAG: hypothetical protein MUO76_09695, partial [Anaerolineaceae bacterium]|nr:hypothetical protein [Anaerolineaceae bacterium]